MAPAPLSFTMLVPNLPQLFKFPLKLLSHSCLSALIVMAGGLALVAWSLMEEDRQSYLVAGIFIHCIGLLAVEVDLESQAETCLQKHHNEE